MTRQKIRSIAPLLVLLAVTSACGTSACAGRLAAPAQLSTAGVTAYHGDRVIKAIAVLQDTAIAGEAQGVVARDDARKVIAATAIAGQAGVELAEALRVGLSAEGAKAKAVDTIRQALTSIPPQLSAKAREVIDPYVTVGLTALAFLE